MSHDFIIPAREARGITKCVGSNLINVRPSVRPHYSGGDLWFFGGFWLFRVPVLVAICDFWNELYVSARHFYESSWRGGEILQKNADLNVILPRFGSFLCLRGSRPVGLSHQSASHTAKHFTNFSLSSFPNPSASARQGSASRAGPWSSYTPLFNAPAVFINT